MESLFGHLCSTRSFAHDQEMKAFKKNQGISKEGSRLSKATYVDATETPSSELTETTDRDHSNHFTDQIPDIVDQLTFEQKDMQYYSVKRPRLSNLTEDTTEESKSTEVVSITDASTDKSLGRRIQAIKKSFDEECYADLVRSVVSSANTTSAPLIDMALANSTTSGSDVQYETALDDTESESSDDEETQLSLPDSAFDSQQTRSGEPVDSRAKIQQRKQAYKAAKSFDGREWAAYSPISSNPSYLEEELG